MPLSIKSGGQWQTPKGLYIKTAGQWSVVAAAWVKSAGGWLKVFPNSIETDVELIIIGGGGGANNGCNKCGGGGAEVIVTTAHVSSGQGFNVTVGAGGTGGVQTPWGNTPPEFGTDGYASSFGDIVARPGLTDKTAVRESSHGGTSGNGNVGGPFVLYYDPGPAQAFPTCGGGGGTGAVGGNPSGRTGGPGGNGVNLAELGWRGGGGGGGGNAGIGPGGAGGGGNGGNQDPVIATDGAQNTGGGGGGGGSDFGLYTRGGNGGSGLVRISYPSSLPLAATTGNPTIEDYNGKWHITFLGSGSIIF